MLRIAPSILSADFARLGQQVQEAESAGADWLHVDVMDGHFVPAITFGVPIVASLHAVTTLPLDVHLMIEPVEPHLEAFAAAGASVITVHVEAVRDVTAVVRRIRALGVRAGLTLRPGTAESAVLPYLADVDLVLVMTVEPGKGGQPFMPEMLPRVAALAQRIRAARLPVDLEVDGGIGPANAAAVVQAGADVLVAGSAIFRSRDGIAAALRDLRARAAPA
ncbi:MAG: ribulose-phosphate 3-epimerase [Actinobacteria bacterium]|nr:ribulose-phosphate 3-epimerase [Actinomycetota bacterium]